METRLKVGDIVDVEVTRITDFGAFTKIDKRNSGLIHISQVADGFVDDINKHLKVGDRLKARVIKVGPGKNFVQYDCQVWIKGPMGVSYWENH